MEVSKKCVLIHTSSRGNLMSNMTPVVEDQFELKFDLGEPPHEINDRNEEAELARWAARQRAANIAGDD